MARQNSALHSAITVAKARRSLVSGANESGHSSGVLAGKIRRLERLSTDQTRTFFPNFGAFRIMSDNGRLSDIIFARQARRIARQM
jgi:hypothetical protein